MPVQLLRPSADLLPGYVDALRRGWSPDNVRGKATADEHLARITMDSTAFLDSLHDPEGRGAPVTLPDGSQVQRLPGFIRWIWDGEYCGSIGLRWRPGTSELPDYVPGHVGYSVVPWKSGRRYATRALALILPEARAQGLAWIELATDPDNLPSQRVILANAGALLGGYTKPESYGGGEGLRFRIAL